MPLIPKCSHLEQVEQKNEWELAKPGLPENTEDRNPA